MDTHENLNVQLDKSIVGLCDTRIYKHFFKLACADQEYVQQVNKICQMAINIVNLMVNMYLNYTKHDILHICNVLKLMAEILDDEIDNLSADEAALLLMAACWHDTGMSVSDSQKKHLLSEDDEDIWNRYFRDHDADRRRYAEGETDKEKLIPNLIRAIHHERVRDQLIETDLWDNWPIAIGKHIAKEDLYMVCKSHGEKIQIVNDFSPRSATVDLRLCSILLRIADILDFDYTRAPKEIFFYLGLNNPENRDKQLSSEEWKKHMGSYGFSFQRNVQKSNRIRNTLIFSANSSDPTTHHAINEYIDWVEKELDICQKEIEKYSGRWNKRLLFPDNVERRISTNGFEAEDFSFSVDKDQIMDLLKGENVYDYKGLFIRELIQNALDAVEVRRKLEKDISGWMPRINIYSWTKEGYTWIAVDDNVLA